MPAIYCTPSVIEPAVSPVITAVGAAPPYPVSPESVGNLDQNVLNGFKGPQSSPEWSFQACCSPAYSYSCYQHRFYSAPFYGLFQSDLVLVSLAVSDDSETIVLHKNVRYKVSGVIITTH